MQDAVRTVPSGQGSPGVCAVWSRQGPGAVQDCDAQNVPVSHASQYSDYNECINMVLAKVRAQHGQGRETEEVRKKGREEVSMKQLRRAERRRRHAREERERDGDHFFGAAAPSFLLAVCVCISADRPTDRPTTCVHTWSMPVHSFILPGRASSGLSSMSVLQPSSQAMRPQSPTP